MSNALALPLSELIQGADLQRVGGGESGASTYVVVRPGQALSFLKVARGAGMDELRREHDLLQFLQGRFGAPQVIAFEAEERKVSILMQLLSGVDAGVLAERAEIPVSHDRLLTLLAANLRRIHALSVYLVPFRTTLAGRLAAAREQVANGRVRLDDLDPARAGWSADQLLAELVARRPKAPEDLVFTHGDYCLPNVILTDDHDVEIQVAGCVDWGRAGVADRYQDLALLIRSFACGTNTTREVVFAKVAAAYGIPAIDVAKYEFYELLDEFF